MGTIDIGSKIDRKEVSIVILFIILFSMTWSALPLLGIGDYEVEPFGLSCTLEWNNPTREGRIYLILTLVMVIALPFLLTILCYSLLLYHVHRHLKSTGLSTHKDHSPSEMQLTLVSISVCLGFMVAWLPYAGVSTYYGVLRGGQPPRYLALVPVLLAKSSCAYNPFIYVFVTQRYKQEVIGLISARLLERLFSQKTTQTLEHSSGEQAPLNDSRGNDNIQLETVSGRRPSPAMIPLNHSL